MPCKAMAHKQSEVKMTQNDPKMTTVNNPNNLPGHYFCFPLLIFFFIMVLIVLVSFSYVSHVSIGCVGWVVAAAEQLCGKCWFQGKGNKLTGNHVFYVFLMAI